MARNQLYPPSVKPGIPKLGKKPSGWEKVKFGDVLEIVKRPAKLSNNTNYQLVVAKRNRGGIYPRSILKGAQVKTKTQFYIKADDFLISRRQIIHGACGVVPKQLDGAIVSNEYSTLRTNARILVEYLKYFTYTVYFQQTCFQSSVGVDVEKMIFKLDHWLNQAFYLPPMAEQLRIIEMLSTWDRAESIARILIQKWQLKKQAISSTIYRDICNGNMGSNCTKAKLHNIAHTFSGGTPSRSVSSNFTGNIPWVKSGEIKNGYIENTEERISDDALNCSSAKMAKKGSVLVAMYGATAGQVALTHIDAAINQAILAVTSKDAQISNEYISFALKATMQNLLKSVQGSGQPNLNSKLIRNHKIYYPDIETQNSITYVVNSYDNYIRLQDSLKNSICRQRRGLLDRVFGQR